MKKITLLGLTIFMFFKASATAKYEKIFMILI